MEEAVRKVFLAALTSGAASMAASRLLMRKEHYGNPGLIEMVLKRPCLMGIAITNFQQSSARGQAAGCFILDTVHHSTEAICASLQDQSARLTSMNSMRTDRLVARTSEGE